MNYPKGCNKYISFFTTNSQPVVTYYTVTNRVQFRGHDTSWNIYLYSVGTQYFLAISRSAVNQPLSNGESQSSPEVPVHYGW